MSALEQKADELEKKNKELANFYEKLKQEVQKMKTALLNDKTTVVQTTSTNLPQASETFANNTTVENDANPSISNHQNETVRSNSNLFEALLQAAKNSHTNQDQV